MLVAALVGAAFLEHGSGQRTWWQAQRGGLRLGGKGLQAAAPGLQSSLCSEPRPARMAFLHSG